MADVHSKKVRSYNMSRIRSSDTKPEVLVRRFLHSQGFRFRTHDKKLPGKPDIVLTKYRTVIFVHGCFWHGHKRCKYFVMPKSNRDYWVPKISRNISKDKSNIALLKRAGWRVITVWECNLKGEKALKTLAKLRLLISR